MIVKMIQTFENRMEKMQELINKDLGELQWQGTPVLLPGESHGWRSLVGYSAECLFVCLFVCFSSDGQG